MKHARLFLVAIIALSVSVFALWGCPKNAQITAAPEASKGGAARSGEQKPGVSSETGTQAKGGPAERSSTSSSGMQPIYFDFNKSFVRGDARQVMKANAEWLKANPTVKVRIEGNCDERGTKEYNQSLGQRRASSAKKFLTDLGIPARRITLLSYGKEKPVCTESTEECWQKNRRDDFSAVSE
jgi:peptidoglycan-associated lipoprotein